MRTLFKFTLELIRDFLVYREIGFAKPDDPDQKNYPIIKGSSDAISQMIIDQSKGEGAFEKK